MVHQLHTVVSCTRTHARTQTDNTHNPWRPRSVTTAGVVVVVVVAVVVLPSLYSSKQPHARGVVGGCPPLYPIASALPLLASKYCSSSINSSSSHVQWERAHTIHKSVTQSATQTHRHTHASHKKYVAIGKLHWQHLAHTGIAACA